MCDGVCVGCSLFGLSTQSKSDKLRNHHLLAHTGRHTRPQKGHKFDNSKAATYYTRLNLSESLILKQNSPSAEVLKN